MPGLQPSKDIDAAGTFDGLSCLGKNVIRERISGHGCAVRDIQSSIPVAAEFLQCGDADVLRRNTDPDVPVADHVLPGKEPHVLGVKVVCDVEPFDQDGSVESLRIGRPADHNTRLIWMVAVDDGSGSLRRCVVAARRALDEELFFNVAVNGQIVIRRKERVVVCRRTGNSGGCDRAGDDGTRDLA